MLLLAVLSAIAAAASQDSSEVVIRDLPPTFTERVNLVLVPVVVRDSKGTAVGGLQRDDFQLFDGGKRQTVSSFSAEIRGASAAAPGQAPSSAAAQPDKPPALGPQRFIAYLFDDVHLKPGDMIWVRDGVERNLATLEPTDRAAIFTTSGRTTSEFTNDRATLHATLLKLAPRTLSQSVDVPEMSYYQANMIVNMGGDPVMGGAGPGADAFKAAAREAELRLLVDSEKARHIAWSAALRALRDGDHETQVTCMVLKQVVRRMGHLPGQRAVIFLSPGLLVLPEAQPLLDGAVDLAARLNVAVSALDARGLRADTPDIGQTWYDPFVSRVKQQIDRLASTVKSGALAQVADGTGGRFVESTNDIDAGLKRTASPPEFAYVLGFTPHGIGPDGRFHQLKIRLAGRRDLSVQARRGYYATRRLTDPAEAARQEIQDAVFAPQDIHDPAVEVRTEFSRSGAASAALTVLSHLDFRHIVFRQAEGRHASDVTVVACLFDQNGNFTAGKQTLVSLRLRGQTLHAATAKGYTLKTAFEVKPGIYGLRVAVLDQHGELMAVESSVVEIP
jgi:VWFA-related protein